MSEMIECVARAMCIADDLDPDEDWCYYRSGIRPIRPDSHVAQWTVYTLKARVAGTSGW